MIRVLCLLAIALAGLVCGWVWSQVDVLVTASVAGDEAATWLRTLLAIAAACVGIAVVGLTADRRQR